MSSETWPADEPRDLEAPEHATQLPQPLPFPPDKPITGENPQLLGEGLLNRVKARAKSQGLSLRFRGFSRPKGEVVFSGAGADGRDPQPLAAEISKLASTHGWEPSLKVGDIVNRWAQIVGPDVAAHCEVESFDEGKLVLRAASTAWAQELKRLTPQLITRIVDELGSGAVVDLTVHGPVGRSFQRGRKSVPGRGPRDTYG